MAVSTSDVFIPIDVPDAGFRDARFRAHIVGVSALLMNSPAGMRAASDELKRSSESNVPLPGVEAESKAYRLSTGELYIPPAAIRGSMVEAGKEFRNPTNKRATLTKPVAAALGAPASEAFVLHDGDGAPVLQYVLDSRRAVVQKQGIVRSRARINPPWQAWIEFSYDASLIAAEQLAVVLAAAGHKVGILDFRPQKSGPYGRFAVHEFGVAE
jgi:hypothetical protein